MCRHSNQMRCLKLAATAGSIPGSLQHIADAQVLHFDVFIHAVVRTLAAQTRLLHTPKGHVLGGDDAHVDAHHAVFQRFAHTENSTHVAAVEVTGQTELGVVGCVDGFLLGVETKHRRKRAKGFFFGAQHVTVGISHHGGLEKLALQGFAAGDDLAAALQGIFEVTLHLGDGGGFNQGTLQDAVFKAVAHLERLHFGGKFLDELVVHAALHINAVGTHTGLAGQTCVCANRIYVQSGVYDEFVQKFSAKVQALKVGNGFEDGVLQGPLIEPAAVAKVQRHLEDALQRGGKIVTGGKPLQGQFFQPTVVADAHSDMLCAKEETFGPFAPVFRFNTEQEAIDAANNTEFGLASYFYSRDVGRIFRVSEALEYGMVGINVGIIATEHVPFGGVKQSGLGREGSHHGMDEYVEMKYLCIGDVLK